jgi:predicted dehydrogenase
MNRRHFLAASASAASLAAIQTRAFAGAEDKPLRVALIGTGWYGKTDLFHLMQVAPVEVVGLCDVDSKAVAAAAELVSQRQPSKKKPPTFSDYRKLLAEQKPEIALIATPDHWHALPMIEACRSGADVYVQKPISVDVVEAQSMLAAARKYKRTVQVGLQRRSTPHLLEARDRFIKTGKLGNVGYVDIHSYGWGPGKVRPDQSPPPNLDWETYVGPAPWRNYNPDIHPRRWRDFRTFGNGKIGDLCIHFFDVVRYFLGLKWPRTIAGTGGVRMIDFKKNPNQPDIPDTQTVVYDFGNTDVVWTHRAWGENPEPKYQWGATLYGDRGTLKISVHGYDFTPLGEGQPEHGEFLDERDKYPEDVAHKETELFAAPATRRHMRNFLAARREGTRPVSDIEEGYISTACCILGNVSMDLGRSLAWDAAAGRIEGDDAANEHLSRAYRQPWQHPKLESV